MDFCWQSNVSAFLFFSLCFLICCLLLLLLLLSHFSCVWLCATPEMTAYQALLSLGFSRQEHWSGLPFPSPMHEREKWKWSRSVVSDFSRSHGLQPTRLLGPWGFPSKSTGVGCHHLLRPKDLGIDNSLWVSLRQWEVFLVLSQRYILFSVPA